MLVSRKLSIFMANCYFQDIFPPPPQQNAFPYAYAPTQNSVLLFKSWGYEEVFDVKNTENGNLQVRARSPYWF